MKVRQLSREQLMELKLNYLAELVSEGKFAQVIGRDYDEPSYADMAEADEIIPDRLVFRRYRGYNFTQDDFFCSAASTDIQRVC
jgi:hypothetical protein